MLEGKGGILEFDQKTILFYDGECGLCSHVVQWVYAQDRVGRVYFAGLKSELGKSLGLDLEESVVFWHGGKFYRKIDAVKAVCACIGPQGFWLMKILSYCPRPFGNWVYDQVARRRQSLGLKCQIPSPELRARIYPFKEAAGAGLT